MLTANCSVSMELIINMCQLLSTEQVQRTIGKLGLTLCCWHAGAITPEVLLVAKTNTNIPKGSFTIINPKGSFTIISL